jgi:DNA-binding CsgD family transcriptional regulator/tetratricopeptide (TPR) repeat protein
MMRAMGATDARDRGLSAFEREAWAEAHRELAAADAESPLAPEDLDRLATAAYLIGKEASAAETRARAHAGFLGRGDPVATARAAIFLAFSLIGRPSHRAQAGGWMARARRLVDECGRECAEQGLVLCALAFDQAMTGAVQAGLSAFEQAEAIGTRLRDPDLLALARHGKARCLIRLNRAGDGFALMDEVMIAVTGGEVMPIIAGVVYCSLISACHDAFDLQRAQEWTTALAGWCAAHPDMVPFRGQCLIHRAELLQLHGDWPQATAESDRAADLCGRTESGVDLGAACYQRGELYRLAGDFARADECYRRASQAGRKPYPGLALLRLAQDQPEAAEAVVRSILAEIRDPRARPRSLGVCVEVLLARQDLEGAQAACDELSQAASELDAPVLHAAAAHASGRVALASGDAADALPRLGQALTLWQQLAAPYEMARVRVSIGLAYRRTGDEDGARMEFDAAQEAFERLGAGPDARGLAAMAAPTPERASGPLTGREVEVLRLAATGKTNRLIASELAISEKTVARHMSNIFTKLDLPSRTAATAYAYEHKLL